MNYIEPHGHMVSRTTTDYEQMALAGCVAISEPAFWAGFDRDSVRGFYDYFRQLTEYEPARAKKFGIQHFCWICINPKEGDDPGFAREVIEIIPDFLKKPNVLGVGEIGLNKNTKNELVILEEQIDLAVKHKQLIDHVEEHTVAEVLDKGFWAGMTLYPETKCTSQRAADIIEMYGTERLWMNSACDWGISDPLAVPKARLELKRRGHTEAVIKRLTYDNPHTFLSQSPNFTLAD